MIDGEPHQEVPLLGMLGGPASPARRSRSSSKPYRCSSLQSDGTSAGQPSCDLPPVLQLLQGVGVIELLEQDERPTFIIDLANSANFDPGPLHIIFSNASLRAAPLVSDLLLADTTDPEHGADFSRFKAWVVSFVKDNESMDVCLPSLSYAGISWSCSTLRKRFRFVSGNISAVSITPTFPSRIAQAYSVLEQRARGPMPVTGLDTPKEDPAGDVSYFGDANQPKTTQGSHVRSHSEPRSKAESVLDPLIQHTGDLALDDSHVESMRLSFDWTRIPLDAPNLPSHIRFARSVDWAATPLGPVDTWPPDLRSTSNMIMGSTRPAAMYWGPEFIAIYNEAYISVAGQKHPRLMGMRYPDAWPEIWHEIKPVFENAWTSCQATTKHEDRLFLARNGYLEETFVNWSIVPLVGSDGSVVALYNPTFDSTRRKVNERRTLSLHEVGEKTAKARDVRAFWAQVKSGLMSNEFDVPFALIYSVSRDIQGEVGSTHSSGMEIPHRAILEGALGVPPGHPVAVPSIDFRSTEEGFAPYMRESVTHLNGPVVLRREDGTLPGELIEGLAWRGFGDPCRTIVVFPVHPTAAGETTVGFIVLGINPRRPYDDDYELFVNILSRQLATSLASVVLFEEEIMRGQKEAQLAALDRQELSMQLRLRTEEAVESEYRFTRMAEFAPVGMFIADGRGVINYCNDTWWEISSHPRSANTVDAWMQSIRDEDRKGVEEVWRRLVNDKVAITHEFRFKRSRQAANGKPIDTWVLMSAYPEKGEAGSLKSIFGCMTDISQQKRAEDFEKQRREEAVELKRQQENFIDITSHEMRNPLSAILQCADEISGSLMKYRLDDVSSPELSDFELRLDNCIEAANTISLCANHQKRIVDDILTLSKLDSQLLLVTPVDTQPVVVVENVFRMFESELKSNDITGEFQIDKSYLDLDIDWYKLDPSRLRQVMINLMTNAIKFTQGRETRAIVVSLAASKDVSQSGFSYFTGLRDGSTDLTDEADWGDGEKVNLHLSVTDTGPGLDDDEMNILFQRFSQASPRTHVQYGGSGLGLFICRILTELQGGQIGVRSEKGVGSTFDFYIKSRIAHDPHPDPTSEAARAGPRSTRSPDSLSNAPMLQYSTRFGTETSRLRGIASRNIEMAANFARDSNARPPLDILIVEDNLVNQQVLQRQLSRSGNNTYVANHGGEALEALRRSRFWTPPCSDETTNISVILMDLEMPVMDGMTCARKIRELEREGTISQHIPILAVTAYARREQIANAKEAGVVSTLSSSPFALQPRLRAHTHVPNC